MRDPSDPSDPADQCQRTKGREQASARQQKHQQEPYDGGTRYIFALYRMQPVVWLILHKTRPRGMGMVASDKGGSLS